MIYTVDSEKSMNEFFRRNKFLENPQSSLYESYFDFWNGSCEQILIKMKRWFADFFFIHDFFMGWCLFYRIKFHRVVHLCIIQMGNKFWMILPGCRTMCPLGWLKRWMKKQLIEQIQIVWSVTYSRITTKNLGNSFFHSNNQFFFLRNRFLNKKAEQRIVNVSIALCSEAFIAKATTNYSSPRIRNLNNIYRFSIPFCQLIHLLDLEIYI